VADRIARDQLGVVEIVARIHAHARCQAPPHRNFLACIEERDLDAVDLLGVIVDDRNRAVHRAQVVAVAPVAFQRGVEHLAQPVNNDGLLDLPQNPVVDTHVVVGRPRNARQRAARHEDDAAAQGFDRGDLFFIRANHIVEGARVLRGEMIGPGAARDQRPGNATRRVQGPSYELERGRPVETHPALCGVHGLGYAQAQ